MKASANDTFINFENTLTLPTIKLVTWADEPVPAGNGFSWIFRVPGGSESPRPVEMHRSSNLLHSGSMGALHNLLLDSLSLVNLPGGDSRLSCFLSDGTLLLLSGLLPFFHLLLGRLLRDRLCFGLGRSLSLGGSWGLGLGGLTCKSF